MITKCKKISIEMFRFMFIAGKAHFCSNFTLYLIKIAKAKKTRSNNKY